MNTIIKRFILGVKRGEFWPKTMERHWDAEKADKWEEKWFGRSIIVLAVVLSIIELVNFCL